MNWLNYHHLLYFWTVSREGGLAPAAARLKLSPQTISGQIHLLEEALGEKLFSRRGRRLELTETGRVVRSYADEIFSLGRDLVEAVRSGTADRAPRLVIGIAEVIPKLLARQLLGPILEGEASYRLVCKEDHAERLLVELAAHRVDALLVDRAIPASAGVRAFNHLLGESTVTWFAHKREARRLRVRFPECLDGARVLLPTEEAAMRSNIDAWLETNALRPKVVAEFDDNALLKVFAHDGLGLFPAPTAMKDAIVDQYDVEPIGEVDVRERYYVVTLERRLQHPAIRQLTERARREVFAIEGLARTRT